MAADRSEVLLIGPARPVIAKGLAGFNLHESRLRRRTSDALLASIADVGAMAVTAPVQPINDALFSRSAQARNRFELRGRL